MENVVIFNYKGVSMENGKQINSTLGVMDFMTLKTV